MCICLLATDFGYDLGDFYLLKNYCKRDDGYG